MPSTYDIAVVGGGHNGLVAATYLARAGRRVVVFEKRPSVGGPLVTEELRPGWRCPSGAALVGMFRPEIVEDLQLARHGLAFVPCDPSLVALDDGGTALSLWRDRARTQQELGRRSASDAEAYGRFCALMGKLAEVMDPLLLRIPPSLADLSWKDEWFLFRRAFRLRRLGRDAMYEALRIPFMSLRAVLSEWFEDELLRASLAYEGLFGIFRGPWSPYTGMGILPRFLAEQNGGWGFVRGGSGVLADALAAAAREAGVEIRTGTGVRRILTQDGRATGVELESDEAIGASVVVSNADPKRTFLRLVDPADLGADFLLRVRNFDAEGCVAKVNVALQEAPRIPALGDGARVPPRLQVAPSLEYIERAYDDAKHGDLSREPCLDVAIPTAVDPGLAPGGKHILSILTQYAPCRLAKGTWEDRREELGERVLDVLEPRISNVRSALAGMEVLAPSDLEERYGLTGGHIFHGEMTIHQQYVLRPVPGYGRYRTPIEGLYLCGAGAHPGGGITGAPGYNAARAILEDLRGRRAT